VPADDLDRHGTLLGQAPLSLGEECVRAAKAQPAPHTKVNHQRRRNTTAREANVNVTNTTAMPGQETNTDPQQTSSQCLTTHGFVPW
jgi:hypothetical protein